MKPDLIFHLVSRRKWKERQQNGYYQPDKNGEGDSWIRCYLPEEVEEAANAHFSGRKNIFMLVINTNNLTGKLEFRELDGKSVPMIKSRINLDAVIDKILLVPDKEGKFEIKIEVKE